MKEVKKVKYNKNVPKEIIDLMGDTPYKFISSYNTNYWEHSNISPRPELPTKVHRSVDASVERLSTDLRSSLDYIQSLIDRYGEDAELNISSGYYGGEVSVEYWEDYTPTEKEVNNYNNLVEIWDKEKVIFDKLDKLVKTIIKERKKLSAEAEIKKLEAQLSKLKKSVGT